MNLAKSLEMSTYAFPDRTAVIDGDETFSYTRLNEDANRVATALAGMSVGAGDHVALCAPNSYQWVAFYFGVLKLGAVAVTLSSALAKADLNQLLGDARPLALFTFDEKLAEIDGEAKNTRVRELASR